MNEKLRLKLAHAELRAALGMDDFEPGFVEIKAEQYARRLTIRPDGTVDPEDLRALVKEIAATADPRWKRKPLAGPTYWEDLRRVLDAERKREAEKHHPAGPTAKDRLGMNPTKNGRR